MAVKFMAITKNDVELWCRVAVIVNGKKVATTENLELKMGGGPSLNGCKHRILDGIFIRVILF